MRGSAAVQSRQGCGAHMEARSLHLNSGRRRLLAAADSLLGAQSCVQFACKDASLLVACRTPLASERTGPGAVVVQQYYK